MPTTESLPQWHPPPVFHLRPLRGWMNDPCAPGYDVSTGTYHLFYQWNPKSCDWGDITWGHYTSKDGLRWTHNGSDAVLKPSEPYDQCGVFTGCLYPSGPQGEPEQLTVLYTSACHLPINWALPYTRNSEGLAMATSCDGGRTWTKSVSNPIVRGEPDGVGVTGWRDPFVAAWPALDRTRGILEKEKETEKEKEKTLYGIVSGGIRGSGPALFLYAVASGDLSSWDYLGPLVHFTEGSYRPTRWTGNYGVNWECGNFLTLGDGADEERHFVLVGSEGGVKPDTPLDAPLDAPLGSPYGSWLLWMSGELTQTKDGPRLIPNVFGLLDHGLFYAASSYEHPITKQRIIWGWLKEDTLALDRREAKGWAGFQALPRELFLLRLTDVTEALKTPLDDIASLIVKPNAGTARTKTVYTLGVRPLPGLEGLRRGDPTCWVQVTHNHNNHNSTSSTIRLLATCRSPSYELEAIVRVVPSPRGMTGHQRVGFHLRHNDNLSRRVTVYFDVQAETIVLDRSQTNDEAGMPRNELAGPFTLFRQATTGWETLRLRIFGDGDTIEVFVNDRFALSGVAYLDSTFTGISSFVEGVENSVVFERVRIWDDMASCLA